MLLPRNLVARELICIKLQNIRGNPFPAPDLLNEAGQVIERSRNCHKPRVTFLQCGVSYARKSCLLLLRCLTERNNNQTISLGDIIVEQAGKFRDGTITYLAVSEIARLDVMPTSNDRTSF